MVDTHPIPTTIVNGFLGSGKTTIITHWLNELSKNGRKVVYVKNEIGKTDVDAQILRSQNILARELLNGCICCTLVGPFVASINEVAAIYRPDQIIIESAGTADPASLALMVSNHPLLARDGVIAIVDVVNFDGYEQIDEIRRRQTEFTDLIVFNKVELVNDQRKRQVVGYVRELNDRTPIVEAPKGKISPELVFGLGITELTRSASATHHDHATDDDIQAFTISLNQPITKAKIENCLKQLPPNIFRVKGYFAESGQTWVVNHIFRRTSYDLAPTLISDPPTKLIFIGYQALLNQDQIENCLKEV